jgi:hypothetical protein
LKVGARFMSRAAGAQIATKLTDEEARIVQGRSAGY